MKTTKTTNKTLLGILALAVLASIAGVHSVQAQGTRFTYQGRLIDAGSPASGNYDLRFTVWDSAIGGLQVGGPVVVAPVPVSGGLFAVPLDFGAAVFTGPARWLQIESRVFGGPIYSTITTRQELTASPYAITARNLTGSLTDASLSANVALLNRDPQTFSGQNNFSANVTFTDPLKGIVFPATAGANGPMLTMFASGTANANRMVIAHSPTFSDFGLQYQDSVDKFNFLSAGNAVMTVDLANQRVGIGTLTPQSKLDIAGTVRINNNDIFLRSGTDNNHGLGYRATVDGPFLYGFNGGGLGVSGPDLYALKWGFMGDVAINRTLTVDENNANVGALSPGGLIFGAGSGEGIASKRDAGGNQYGLDFYTGFQNRMSINNAGYVGIGTSSPEAPLQLQNSQAYARFSSTSTANGSVLELLNATAGNNTLGAVNFTDGLSTPGQIAYTTGSGLSFRTGGSQRMVITESGNFSIASPNSTIQFPATSGANAPMINMFASGSGNADRMVIAHSPTFASWGLQYQDSSDKFNFLGAGTAVMTVDLNLQRVGVLRSAAANALEVEGNASKTAAGGWLANSDARIKTDIETLANPLEKLDLVRLVSFRYTDAYRAAHKMVGDRRHLNVVAQEFREVFPEYVKGSGEKLASGEEILQVDTYPLTIYSAAAIQELHRGLKDRDAKIAALEKANDEMKRELAAQKELTSRMEARFTRVEKVLARIGEKSDAALLSVNH